ncbi:SAM-dependent methyltransferase [Actinomadura meridiana]|uniref:SAM-dependent methyltransferase n=1 Tax=Actinomadura meridiana TaxID=559626 RepID=A0ABP8CC00_9ACTN
MTDRPDDALGGTPWEDRQARQSDSRKAEGMANLPELNTAVAHEARVYDYWLGGKDNYAADRELGDAMTRAIPTLPLMARANRAFMERVVRHVVAEGVTQFLDIGTGIPTSPNLHEVAQRIEPSSRVVYVDNDPLVLAHARALMHSDPAGATAYIHADLTDPDTILADPLFTGTLDLTRPVALTMVAVLMYFTDDSAPERWVMTLLDALAPGSLVVISHPTADFDPPAVAAAVDAAAAAGITLVCRDRIGVETLFGGATLLDPGVVPLAAWRPDMPPSDPHAAYYYAGLARKK